MRHHTQLSVSISKNLEALFTMEIHTRGFFLGLFLSLFERYGKEKASLERSARAITSQTDTGLICDTQWAGDSLGFLGSSVESESSF